MTTKSSTKRDLFDYADIIVKILSGGILVIVSFILKYNNDLKEHENALIEKENQLKQQVVGNSLKYGEFTKTLMNDLLTKDDTHFRSDIALITLNRTIGNDNKQLVADLGARLIESYISEKAYKNKDAVDRDQSGMKSVLKIIKERDNSTYLMALQLVSAYNPRLTQSKPNTTVVNSITDQSWAKITLIQAPAIVFMQVNKNTIEADEKTDKLQGILKANKFTVPAKEVVTKSTFKNMVKYYYEEDRPAAEKIRALSKNYLADAITLVKRDDPKARKGLIELWCNY
ncbi:hypothetical protein [Mucilaginibacter phyllosphaerae]|uniref:Uncharacterized protein n=1 Tax=Mucilaginibacter phyllosphaerae TaxID=1812349 RepID=A0A4Y8AG08_9SPHI|nr:hypothetical protein [Mucilaginibacter phyllosphaerae]MBB3970455.1 hypothetical protein [Mucilaginibacter phyllosphaerae]TEW66951.1 hypothetical protein E2R65_11140 [Mucilaginibacter phyllosphaerae]GGH12992.1 hypothetical protein GCM10007352_20170 [Mucilaginibacter phyllosphaerae]